MAIEKEIDAILKAHRSKTISQLLLQRPWWRYADIPWNQRGRRRTPCIHFEAACRCALKSHTWPYPCSTTCADYQPYRPSQLKDTYGRMASGTMYHIITIEKREDNGKAQTLCNRYGKLVESSHDLPIGSPLCPRCEEIVPETVLTTCVTCGASYERWEMLYFGNWLRHSDLIATGQKTAEPLFMCYVCEHWLRNDLRWTRGRRSHHQPSWHDGYEAGIRDYLTVLHALIETPHSKRQREELWQKVRQKSYAQMAKAILEE